MNPLNRHIEKAT